MGRYSGRVNNPWDEINWKKFVSASWSMSRRAKGIMAWRKWEGTCCIGRTNNGVGWYGWNKMLWRTEEVREEVQLIWWDMNLHRQVVAQIVGSPLFGVWIYAECSKEVKRDTAIWFVNVEVYPSCYILCIGEDKREGPFLSFFSQCCDKRPWQKQPMGENVSPGS